MSWFKKLLFQIFAHGGFVKAWTVGWIPTTRIHLYYKYMIKYYKCMLVFATANKRIFRERERERERGGENNHVNGDIILYKCMYVCATCNFFLSFS